MEKDLIQPVETYSLPYRCKNCGNQWTQKIEKGHRKPELIKCPNCECYEGNEDFIPLE
jgi:hypothetical protein